MASVRPVRSIGGKKFYLHSNPTNKAEANRRAESWRRGTNMPARVVPVGRKHAVYISD